MGSAKIAQVAVDVKCHETGKWELNWALHGSQWIDKSPAYLQRWLGYVYPSRAGRPPSSARSGLTSPLHTCKDGLDMSIQAEQEGLPLPLAVD